MQTSNYLKLLGKNIAQQREKLNLKQTQLAELIGVKPSTVSQWENGRIDIPYSTLCKIAENLKTSPAALANPSVPIKASSDLAKLETISLILSASPGTLSNVLHLLRRDSAAGQEGESTAG